MCEPAVRTEKFPSLSGWNLDASGCLTVYGQGILPDFSPGNGVSPPWSENMHQIRKVVLSEGITELGARSFENCLSLQTVRLPSSLTRIRAFAFRNCLSLEEVEAGEKTFRYLYDKRPADGGELLRFGLGAFAGTPWARNTWGQFYTADGVLYICFEGGNSVTVPDGIRRISMYAFSGITADTLFLPSSVEELDRFALSESDIRELVSVGEIRTIHPFALADCRLEKVEFSHSLARIRRLERSDVIPAPLPRPSNPYPNGTLNWRIWERRQEQAETGPRYSLPLRDMYRITTASEAAFGTYRKMSICPKKTVHHRDGSVTTLYGRNYLDIGTSIYRRLVRGAVVIGITWKENRILSLSAYGMDPLFGSVLAYVWGLLPETGEPFPENLPCFLLNRQQLRESFPFTDGKELMKTGNFRPVESSCREAWFCSYEEGPLNQKVLSSFLEQWAGWHRNRKS